MVIEGKFFLNPLDSYAVNIAKDMFIIATESIHKKITPATEKVLTPQKPVQIVKKNPRIFIPDKFQEKSLNFMKIG